MDDPLVCDLLQALTERIQQLEREHEQQLCQGKPARKMPRQEPPSDSDSDDIPLVNYLPQRSALYPFSRSRDNIH